MNLRTGETQLPKGLNIASDRNATFGVTYSSEGVQGFGERCISARSFVSGAEWNSDALGKGKHSELGSQPLLCERL
jgi:hypothetical protein